MSRHSRAPGWLLRLSHRPRSLSERSWPGIWAVFGVDISITDHRPSRLFDVKEGLGIAEAKTTNIYILGLQALLG